MPIKKKATKKTGPKKAKNKATKKSRTSKAWTKSQKVIDDVLVRISPSLQSKVNHLVEVLENSREGKLGDLRLLGGKILLRAQEVSRGLKALRNRKKNAKK